jgi:hypothetical protein
MISRKKGLAALVAVLALGLLGAGIASAGLLSNTIVRFHGNIGPHKLPRHGVAPVTVQMGGKISTKDGSPPPRLAEIKLEINKHGELDSKGLPLCSLGALKNATTARAKSICGKAEVGHGNVTSRIKLPEQEEFATNGQLLAFNGKYKGKPAIFAHVNSKGRLAITYVIIFQIEKAKGEFGTSLVAKVPPIASGAGHISAFDLSLSRKYTVGKKKKSYVSAGCALPAGIFIGPFKFARATYVFEDGTSSSETLEKTCKARG